VFGFILRNMVLQLPQPRQQVSIALLAAAAEMPLDATGSGTQIISGTTLTFKLQPYPPLSTVTSTVILLAIAPDGKPATAAAPVLNVKGSGQDGEHDFPFAPLPGGAYSATGVFFPSPGLWRLRVDVYVGDDIPAMMLVTANVR
jgi:hypothetical protein